MKSIFDKLTRDELITRINSLNETSPAQWGKMNVAQMIRHCTKWDEMALGKQKYKQLLIGKLLGKRALKDMLKDTPVKKNMPTLPSFKIKETINFREERAKWIMLLADYEHLTTDGFVHPFFGAVSKEQAGYIVYKHIDHHLQQFNV